MCLTTDRNFPQMVVWGGGRAALDGGMGLEEDRLAVV
jgi:hypothetical protein